MTCLVPNQAILRLTRTGAILVLSSVVVAGCNHDDARGSAQGDNNSMVTGRGSGEHGDSGGNGKAYDRGGPPNVSRSDAPGSGRIDQGGGPTTGTPPKSQPSTNTDTNTPGNRPL